MQQCLKGKQTISQLERGKDSSLPAARDQTIVHFAGMGEMGSVEQEFNSSIESWGCCED